MTSELESPIIDLSSEIVMLTALPILITPDPHKKGGVTEERMMETDPRTTICRNNPIASDQLFSVYKEHILLLTSGQGVAVMMATNDLSEIRPLSDLTFGIEKLPERFRSGDIFNEADNVFLIHIGRSDDAELLRAIKERAQVENLIHITPDPDDWRFGQWWVGYDGEEATLRIFPCSGDEYLSYHIDNNSAEKNSLSSEIRRRLDTYEIYQQYRQRGGVIGWQFMGDAAMLSREEMRIIYPRDSKIYIGDPQERLDFIVGRTGIELTEDQKNLFFNLRWIPIEIPQVIYDYGPSQTMVKHPAGEEFVHPARLDEIGILSQVFQFTHDENRKKKLARYCRSREINYG